ncbi:DsbA family oxidoreductase [Seohaeicola saemankumensis]|nr:DsbA family oxidoreductase [Seohaeicola saemankumensis]MCA0873140.1 DsbA family oxidoreductase [Seohaeicola saemankumensis]
MPDAANRPVVQVDIVSDVVCPWCIIGFLQLDQALQRTGVLARLRWHPFELNPDMPEGGQNLREHLIGKYGLTEAQSEAARARLTTLGAELGFTFRYAADKRMVNTFRAHQLLDWAEEAGRQHPLKLALFKAYFTDNEDVSDPQVLAGIAGRAGLDPEQAARELASGQRAAQVREKQRFWLERGIHGVPAMVIGGKYLLTGAQGADTYETALRRALAEAA